MDGCVQVLRTQLVHVLRAILRTSVCKCTLICFLVQKVKALAFDIGFFVKVIPDKKCYRNSLAVGKTFCLVDSLHELLTAKGLKFIVNCFSILS